MKQLIRIALIGFLSFATLHAQEEYKVTVGPGTEPMATGIFTPEWESLRQYEAPEWFRDAKFGIWAHWGPQCQANYGDWYAKEMYIQGHSKYKYHVEKFGHPSEYGFKEMIRDWKAEKWDPARLMTLYKKAGAQYFMALANHHDNFDLYESSYQNWNSLNLGPQRDIVREWAKAAKDNDLYFGVSVHASHAWTWYEYAQKADKTGALAGIPYDGILIKSDGAGTWWDGYDPQELYAQNHPLSAEAIDNKQEHAQWDWSAGASVPDQAYTDKFYNRTIELINKYEPDLLYFDDTTLPLYPISDAGLKIAAHFYNSNMARHNGKLEAALFGKILTDPQKECLIWDVERGAPDQIQEKPWQTCTCIGSWHYNLWDYYNNSYKSARQVIHMLADITSKNGSLLLSIPIKGDGSIDEIEEQILQEIGVWMEINGESIYGTRPWKVHGEGPSVEEINPLNAQGFNEGHGTTKTAADIRFNRKGKVLYAICLGMPEKEIFIQSCGKSARLLDSKITKVEVLGSHEKIKWEQTEKALKATVPDDIKNNIAVVYKITMK
ncbi:MAG: alpha-L-fucosidase [Tannerellaceae bacterium]|nr:alpha-L-fucosidase [Tannerellaceae bacterium]